MTALEDRTTPPVVLRDVRKIYGKRGHEVVALAGVTTAFAAGTFTAVMGPSGSGKSTLLQCAAGLDTPTSGTVALAGQSLGELSETKLTKLRRERIGFIFQSFNLLPALTVRQNVTLPLLLAGRRVSKRRVSEVLEQVGLNDRHKHRPAELSGGQQQRVAIARALIAEPTVVFADEPTGALDTRTAQQVLRLLRHSVHAAQQTIIMVTHDPVAASYADRVLFLADGLLVDELSAPSPDAVAERMTHLGAFADEAFTGGAR
jgi:putative ABC transport system ATP-binding protein